MTTKLPETYKCIVVKEANADFVIEERKLNPPKPGSVLIKVLACGVCHSDSVVKKGTWPVPYPLVPGHEVIGDIAAVAEGEKIWKVGDRVGTGWVGGYCSSCTDCRKGSFTTCPKQQCNGIFRDGGYAEYIQTESEGVALCPEGMDVAEAGPLLCAGVTTFNSLRHVKDLHPGDVVAVQGVGGLGHLAIMFARKMGYKVVALSSSDSKKDLALNKLGAHEYLSGDNQIEGLQKMGGAKVIVCTADNPKLISPLTQGLATDGTLLILAGSTGMVEINPADLIQRRAKVAGWPSGSAMDSQDTLNFAHTEDIHCHVQRYNGLDLKEVNKAYDSMMNGDARFRNVLMFQ